MHQLRRLGPTSPAKSKSPPSSGKRWKTHKRSTLIFWAHLQFFWSRWAEGRCSGRCRKSANHSERLSTRECWKPWFGFWTLVGFAFAPKTSATGLLAAQSCWLHMQSERCKWTWQCPAAACIWTACTKPAHQWLEKRCSSRTGCCETRGNCDQLHPFVIGKSLCKPRQARSFNL